NGVGSCSKPASQQTIPERGLVSCRPKFSRGERNFWMQRPEAKNPPERPLWYRYAFEWEDFCKQVQFSARFFGIKERLDELFGKPDEYGGGPVKPLYDLPVGQAVFRARLL